MTAHNAAKSTATGTSSDATSPPRQALPGHISVGRIDGEMAESPGLALLSETPGVRMEPVSTAHTNAQSASRLCRLLISESH
jgi:hypothetical protein